MPKTVQQTMTPKPTTIESSESVVTAARIMRDQDVGVTPVVEDGRLIAMLTDRDIAIRVVAEGKDPQSTTAGETASRELVTIDPQQDLDEALRLMAKHQVRRLPVVEEDGRIVGVLAQADVAKEGSDAKTGELVEEISR